MHSPSFAFLPSVVVTSGAWFAAFFLGGMWFAAEAFLCHPQKDLFYFCGAPRRRGTSERCALDQTTKLSECQPIHPISPSRHVSRVSDYSETTQVMNTRIRILFKS